MKLQGSWRARLAGQSAGLEGEVEHTGWRPRDRDPAGTWQLSRGEEGKRRLRLEQQEGGRGGRFRVERGWCRSGMWRLRHQNGTTGSVPCFFKTLVCHTQESKAAKSSERSISKLNTTWATFTRVCGAYRLKYNISLHAYLWFHAQGVLCLAAAQAHLADCGPGSCPLRRAFQPLAASAQHSQWLASAAAMVPAHLRQALKWEEGFPVLFCQIYSSSEF